MAKSSQRTNYGSTLNPFGKYTGAVLAQDGKYYADTGSGFFGSNKGRRLEVQNPFSDFERNWYMENGFGDPTKLKAQYYDRDGKLIQDPTRYQPQGGTPIIKGQGGYAYDPVDLTKRQSPLGFGLPSYGVTTKYAFQGVSPEARQLYLQATGGKDPIAAQTGQTLGPERTVVSDKQGVGTIQQVMAEQRAPILEDPNQGRNLFRIRRY